MSDGEEATGKKEKKAKAQRNPDGEAVAQFRDQDFDFGGKKKQMVDPSHTYPWVLQCSLCVQMGGGRVRHGTSF